MNQIDAAIRTIAKRLALSIMLLVVMATSGTILLNPAVTSAAPVTFAVVGGGCSLPDGSPGVTVTSSAGNPSCCPPKATDSVSCFYAKYLNPAVQLLAVGITVVIVIAIVYGAIEYITSNADPQRVAQGKQRIINALIGLVAFILLYGFLQFLLPGGMFNAK